MLERDAKIAQLQLDHRKKFKANVKRPAIRGKSLLARGPAGHPGWHRREPDHIDAVVHVDAPVTCPHCQHDSLLPCAELHEHVQEDIVLMPRTRVTKFVHEQCWCPRCRPRFIRPDRGNFPAATLGQSRVPSPLTWATTCR